MRRQFNSWKNFTLLFSSVVLTAAVIEVGLRFGGITPNAERLEAYEFDDTLGWKMRPSFKTYRSSGYFSHFSYTNPDGFPTTAAGQFVPTDTAAPSLVVIGDSFAEGYYLPYEQTFAYLLGQQVPELQVINLGVSGYAPDQYLLNARRHLSRYNVKAIVVTFFAYNDVADVNNPYYQGYSKPLFDSSLQFPINVPLARVDVDPEYKSLFHRIIQSSALYALVRPIVRGKFPFNEAHLAVRRFDVKEMVRSLQFVKAIETEAAIPSFLVYYIPTFEEVSRGELPHNAMAFRLACEELRLRCASMGDIVADLAEPERLYFVGEGHFSPEGSRRVAEHIGAILREAGF